jgi:hypothetical protein
MRVSADAGFSDKYWYYFLVVHTAFAHSTYAGQSTLIVHKHSLDTPRSSIPFLVHLPWITHSWDFHLRRPSHVTRASLASKVPPRLNDAIFMKSKAFHGDGVIGKTVPAVARHLHAWLAECLVKGRLKSRGWAVSPRRTVVEIRHELEMRAKACVRVADAKTRRWLSRFSITPFLV